METLIGSSAAAFHSLFGPLAAAPVAPVIGVGLMVVGLAVTLKGFEWRRVFLGIAGLVIGAAAGIAIAVSAKTDREGLLVAVSVGAAVGAAIGSALYYVALSLCGASMGASVGAVVGALTGDVTTTAVLGILLAVGGAVIAVRAHRLVLVIGSSIVGGAIAGVGSQLVPGLPPVVVVVPCAVGGLAYQLYRLRHAKPAGLPTALRLPQFPRKRRAAAGSDAADRRCPRCGYPNSAAASKCGLCSAPIGAATSPLEGGRSPSAAL